KHGLFWLPSGDSRLLAFCPRPGGRCARNMRHSRKSRHLWTLCIALAGVALSSSCTLISDVDRSDIPGPGSGGSGVAGSGGAAGTTPSDAGEGGTPEPGLGGDGGTSAGAGTVEAGSGGAPEAG